MPVAVQDHPRSRGVYPIIQQIIHLGQGSSPLARGLPVRMTMRLAPYGIIPARAGFTADRAALSGALEDHPRSRGVYEAVGITEHSSDGSSPLARGLLRVCVRIDDGVRIIPARAGFTIFSGRILAYRLDHPRSRGVYEGGGDYVFSLCGSSPLARGLRHPECVGEG